MSHSGESKNVVTVKPTYINGEKGELFVCRFSPECGDNSGRVTLILPPFAEELNKSRRMLSLQARQLARNGFTCVFPDLFGTGDSDGDFSDANWSLWCRDIQTVMSWIEAGGASSIDLLALRSGIFLAEPLFESSGLAIRRVALWSPVVDGRKMINQLMRTRLVATGEGAVRMSVDDCWQQLSTRGSIEIAGYSLSYELCENVASLDLNDLTLGSGPSVRWVDTVAIERDVPPKSSRQVIDHWRTQGTSVDYASVVGAPFWFGPEIEEVHTLITDTSEYLCAH